MSLSGPAKVRGNTTKWPCKCAQLQEATRQTCQLQCCTKRPAPPPSLPPSQQRRPNTAAANNIKTLLFMGRRHPCACLRRGPGQSALDHATAARVGLPPSLPVSPAATAWAAGGDQPSLPPSSSCCVTRDPPLLPAEPLAAPVAPVAASVAPQAVAFGGGGRQRRAPVAA